MTIIIMSEVTLRLDRREGLKKVPNLLQYVLEMDVIIYDIDGFFPWQWDCQSTLIRQMALYQTELSY